MNFSRLFTQLALISLLLFSQINHSYSNNLNEELAVIKKLYTDGILNKEEYEKTKEILIKKSGGYVEDKRTNKIVKYKVNIKKNPGKALFEKAEIIYEDFRIYTAAPGTIVVKRISDDKELVRISREMKVKFSNNGQNIIDIEKKTIKRPTMEEDIKRQLQDIKNIKDGIVDVAKKPKKTLITIGSNLKKALNDPKNFKSYLKVKKRKEQHDKDAIKLILKINDRKILFYEGRYVNKYRAFFYQVITSDFTPLHFYIAIPSKEIIALNMEHFNKKIDKAVRKAKKRISAEYNVSMDEIDKIIERQINESAEDAMNDAIKDAVSSQVMKAVEESLGSAISESFVSAIEKATGEAIDQALQDELASAIDAEIQRAVAMGIEEAAVAAGWAAYFDVLASGGTEAQAVNAAYDACGGPCEGK